eukprot:8903668-Pyramimonas_sp.AAC.1
MDLSGKLCVKKYDTDFLAESNEFQHKSLEYDGTHQESKASGPFDVGEISASGVECLQGTSIASAGDVSPSGYSLTMTDEEFRAATSKLTQMQRCGAHAVTWHVTLERGTERPFANEYFDNHESGLYVSVIGGLPLFSSDAKVLT